MGRASRFGAVIVGLLAGCASPAHDDEPNASTSSAIIGGSADTTHGSVVAILGVDFACTGVVVAQAGGVATVLGGAYCCKANDQPQDVVVGTNYNLGTLSSVMPGSIYVDDDVPDDAGPGSYAGDYCLMTTASNVAAMPVATAPDGLAIGDRLEIVGYGLTTPPPGSPNSVRNHASITLDQLTATQKHWAQAAGDAGACEGDRGGPVLAPAGADPSTQKVVGLISATDTTQCEPGGATANRLASVTGPNGFVGAYRAGHPFGRHLLASGGVEVIPPPSSGTDGGSTTGSDGGVSDGGSLGGGTDGGGSGGGGTSANDAGSSTGGDTNGGDDGGGCSTTGASGSSTLLGLLGFVLVLGRRRRRAR